MSEKANPYYAPEELDLEIVASVDFGGSYEFEQFVVWRHKTQGWLTWGADSGCSCPIPFENFDIEEAPRGNKKDALTDFAAWLRANRGCVEMSNLMDADRFVQKMENI